MKKIKILTIWLLSLWLLGNILFVSANNSKTNTPTPTTKREQIQKVEAKIIWPKVCDQECMNKEIQDRIRKESERIRKQIEAKKCKWIKLNTNFPLVGSCIGFEWGKANQINVFARMVKSLMKLIISVIMLMSLIIIIIAGVMVTSSGYDSGNYKKGLDLINKVATGLALLGASGVILKLINPNFFT